MLSGRRKSLAQCSDHRRALSRRLYERFNHLNARLVSAKNLVRILSEEVENIKQVLSTAPQNQKRNEILISNIYAFIEKNADTHG